MSADLEIKKFESSDVDAILEFARQNPWQPVWPENLMRRFLTELSSGPQMVIDVYEGSRVATAVLVDKINNSGNDATLEILGVRKSENLIRVIEMIVVTAKSLLPASRSGIEFTFDDSLACHRELAARHALQPYYETFEMLVSGLGRRDFESVEEFEMASADNDEELYSVLTACFKNNPDTSIPDFENWVESRRRTPDSFIYLAKQNGRIIGFLNLGFFPDRHPEIRTVGVLPEARGKGIGKRMISYALSVVGQRGSDDCVLTVAVQNLNALGLYRNSGFLETDHFTVYRWSAPVFIGATKSFSA